MTKKERLMSIFDDTTCGYSIAFRYKVKNLETEEEHSIQEFNVNRFKSLKRFFRKRMDDDLIITYNNKKYKLTYAEVLDSVANEETSFNNMLTYLMEHGRVDYLN